jgi:beta-glucosidase-like glycosyl hydrolase
VAFLGAGCDLVLTVVPLQAATMRAATATEAAAKAPWRSRLNDEVRHVLAARIALGLISC